MAGILKVDQVQSDSNLAFNIAGSNVAFMNATSLQMVGSNVSLAGTNVITNGKLVTSAQPTGAVLQVVQGTYQSTVTTTSSSAVATGLTATITPTSATSKILITVFGSQQLVQSGTTNIYSLYKAGSNLVDTFMIYSNPTPDGVAMSASYLDSPATTSATTYALFFRTENGGYTASFGSSTTAGNYLNSITLTEVAA